MMAVRAQANDQSVPPPDEEGWQDLISMLAQAWKLSQYPTWRAAEQLELAPAFWISLREPIEGPWPPTRGASPLLGPVPCDGTGSNRVRPGTEQP